MKPHYSSMDMLMMLVGCPIVDSCGPDWWSLEQIVLLLQCGAHISAKKKEAIAQLRQEIAEKIAGGYARVMKHMER